MNCPGLLLLVWILALGRPLVGLAETPTSRAPKSPGLESRTRILATLPAIHSWAANVAGEDATVECLLSADVGPHDFQFRPSDLRKLAQADVVLMNGLGVDPWLDRAVAQGDSKPSRRVATVTDGIRGQLIHHLTPLAVEQPSGSRKTAAAHDHHHDHSQDGEANPHVWLDPIIAKHCVSNIVQALRQADPSHADGYSRRGDAYLRELDALDIRIRSALKGLENRKVVTFHDAFPYFCKRYDLRLVGVVEEVPHVDPSPRYLAQLSRAIRREKVRVVFSEPQFNPRIVRRLADDLGIRVAELDVLETGIASRTFYIDGLERNLRSLEAALR